MPSATIQHLLVACILSLNINVNAVPLDIRNTTSPPSLCVVTQENYFVRTGQYIGPWRYNITLHDKQTPEKDSPGQGLLDNISGECHHNPSSLNITSFGLDPQTHTLTGYEIDFQLPASTKRACVERAIQKAENKSLSCNSQGY